MQFNFMIYNIFSVNECVSANEAVLSDRLDSNLDF